jgi:hypothetical protein
MINVVKSENVISQLRDRYFMTDINDNKLDDIVMWDNNSIYVKYAKQESEYKNLDTNKTFHIYSPGIFASSYIDSYDEILQKTEKND